MLSVLGSTKLSRYAELRGKVVGGLLARANEE